MAKTKKSYDTRGDIQKLRILKIITDYSNVDAKGIHPHEIARLAKISRQAVHSYLRDLYAEGKIFNKKGLYILRDVVDAVVFDGWSLFEEYIQYNTPSAIRDEKFISVPESERIKINYYRNQDFPSELEQFIFEFANRIGAVMTYLFIESLTPRKNVIPGPIKENIVERVVKEIVPHMSYLWEFHRMLPIDEREKSHFEIGEDSLQTVFNAYKVVYPHLYKSLNEGYLNLADSMLGLNQEITSDCVHEWTPIYVHRLGEKRMCKKCEIIMGPA